MDVKSPPGGEVSLPKSSSLNNLITVKGLNKQFDTKSGSVKVLYDINFDIPNNSFAIIFGPSGSGKTTLLNILSGLEPPTQGTIKIEGQDFYTVDSDQRALFRAQSMGIVHQVNYWVKSLSVLENVAMPLYLTGVEKNIALKMAMQNLDLVGMADFAHTRPLVLSGGQQQRVSMARALVANPQLIMADEPTGNLDSKNGKMIMDLLIKCQKELNRTIILVTHNIEYLPLSDIRLYMVDGKLTQSDKGQHAPMNEIISSLTSELAELTKLEQRQ